MTASAVCPDAQIVEMVISDNYLYSEDQLRNLATQLHDNPRITAVRFCVLHATNCMQVTSDTEMQPFYQMPATTICIEVPSITHTATYYYNLVAMNMLHMLSRQLKNTQAYRLH